MQDLVDVHHSAPAAESVVLCSRRPCTSAEADLNVIQAMIVYTLLFECNTAPFVKPDNAGIGWVQHGAMDFA